VGSRSGERGSLSACGIARCETLFSGNGKAPDAEGYRLAQSLMEDKPGKEIGDWKIRY